MTQKQLKTRKQAVRGGVNALVARLAHAGVEGTAFVWTKEGSRAFAACATLMVLWSLGPRKTTAIALQCSLACSTAKFALVLANGGKLNTEGSLESIWDFEPPGELGSSGLWKVLQELAKTMASGVDSHEELKDLQPIPFSELIVRLTLLYKHVQENPVTDSIPEEDITDRVTPETVETLCQYLYFADQSYDCGTEHNLKKLLEEHGYDLNFAKLEATWAEHCPAYFVATNSQDKELLITVRGTAQVEDCVTDLTALPTKLGDTEELVHGGIHASAVWLFERLYGLSKAMGEAGYRITIVGHSLGAGAAALLAMMYKHGGISSVTCYAFATPNCVSLTLAQECKDYVTSVVFRDDIIARFSPEALAGLHKQLLDLDLAEALQKAREKDDKMMRFIAMIGGMLGSGEEEVVVDEGNDEAGLEEEGGVTEEQASYRPHIPGKILYIYRKEGQTAGEGEEHELAFVKITSPALRCIRLSDKVINDHLIDSYFQGFGRENPSKVRAREEEEAKQREAEEQRTQKEKEKAAKEDRRQQTAEDRDKEEKDKSRSWTAKLGLVG